MSSVQPYEPLPLSLAPKIAAYLPSSPSASNDETSDIKHRINLVNSFRIPASSSVLEIGCGQGTCTVVFGHATGPNGRVDALDPAPLDYGAPFTLGQAQGHIKQGELGQQVHFWQKGVEDFLKETEGKKWDYATLVHCTWYFDTEDVLRRMLAALRGRVGTLCIAEYAMRASEPAAVPHVLAAIARGSLEAWDPQSEANIRCLLAPPDIAKIAEEVGWKLDDETEVVPDGDLRDGHWEVGDVTRKAFLKNIEEHVKEGRAKALIRSSREAVIRSVEGLRGQKIRTMDVWAARFV